MFLGGPTTAPRIPVTRHLFIVAMSNPIDDIGSASPPPAKPMSMSMGQPNPAQNPNPETVDAIWDSVTQKLQEVSA